MKNIKSLLAECFARLWGLSSCSQPHSLVVFIKGEKTENKSIDIPLHIQLSVMCQTDIRQIKEDLTPYMSNKEIGKLYKSTPQLNKWAQEHFSFSVEDLISYLEKHPEFCRKLQSHSADKRYTPSTFIEERKGGKFLVGWVNFSPNPQLITQIRVFSSSWEATADYVLFSWGFPRLTKDQADWYEVYQY